MPYPFQIVQTPTHLVFAYSYANASRIVYMNIKVEPQIDTWMGYSSGRWDGETLVIDSTGFNDQTWFDRAGNFHSDALKVTERYTAISPDALQYRGRRSRTRKYLPVPGRSGCPSIAGWNSRLVC